MPIPLRETYIRERWYLSQDLKKSWGRLFRATLTDKTWLQVLDEVGENVTNGGAKQRQNNDNDDGDQNQDQRVFYQALTFFTGHVQHESFSWMNE